MRGIAIQGRGFDFNIERDHVVTAVEIMRLPTWGLALEPIDDAKNSFKNKATVGPGGTVAVEPVDISPLGLQTSPIALFLAMVHSHTLCLFYDHSGCTAYTLYAVPIASGPVPDFLDTEGVLSHDPPAPRPNIGRSSPNVMPRSKLGCADPVLPGQLVRTYVRSSAFPAFNSSRPAQY
ncbi:hypothetical protein PCH_Pc14g01620 [Penicillium rubens Wisconsin 54-1255]|uniref:Uncharacterized protein n=1 Tax=Penicillium rubens (strain ATCC 28089 / DSM 1075 / NRRL 1951 / Wisconsin 54-1255) TaxID=500485 RepID=B6H5Z0_PENRW|nr:hypothetical protein PCH_Pc14g01620 [Penicillium rubens Wisconsin 54-1255]